MSGTCQAKTAAPPDPKLPVQQWLAAAQARMMSDALCGAPATHVDVVTSKPLCDWHAEQLRQALRSADTLGNVIAGRARTEKEIAAMVRPACVKETADDR